MNHTAVARIFAISMVAALTIVGLSILNSAKVMALSLKFGGFNIDTSHGAVSVKGPEDSGLSVDTGNDNGKGPPEPK